MNTRRTNRSSIRAENNRNGTTHCSEDESPVRKRGPGRPKGSKNKKVQQVVLNINIAKNDTLDKSEGDEKQPIILNLGEIISSLCSAGDVVDKNCTINISQNSSKIDECSPTENNSSTLASGSKTNGKKFNPTVTSSQKKSSRSSSTHDRIHDSDSGNENQSLHLSDKDEESENNKDAESCSSSDIFEESGDKSNKKKSGQHKTKATAKSTEKNSKEKYSMLQSWLMKANNATSTPASVNVNNDLNRSRKKSNGSVSCNESGKDDESDKSTHETTIERTEISDSQKNVSKDNSSNVNNLSVVENNGKGNESNGIISKFRKFTKNRFRIRRSRTDKNESTKNASADKECNLEHEKEDGSEKPLNGDLSARSNELSVPSSSKISERVINLRTSMKKRMVITVGDSRERSGDSSDNQSENERRLRSSYSRKRYSLQSLKTKQPVVVLEKLKAPDVNKINLRRSKRLSCANLREKRPSIFRSSLMDGKDESSDEESLNGNASGSDADKITLRRSKRLRSANVREKRRSIITSSLKDRENESSDEESLNGHESESDHELSTTNKKDSEKRASDLNQVAEKRNNRDMVDSSLPEINLNMSTHKNFDKELLANQSFDSPSKLDGLSQESSSNLVVIPVKDTENIRLVESVVQRILVSPEKNSAISLNICTKDQSKVNASKDHEKSSGKCSTVTSSTDQENLKSKEVSQKDKSSVNESEMVSNKKPDNSQKVISESLRSEFNKSLAMISEVTSTQDDDNKSTNSDKLCIDESLENANAVNTPANNFNNSQKKLNNEGESSIKTGGNVKGKEKKKVSGKSSSDSSDSDSDFRDTQRNSKLMQKADEIIRDRFNGSQRELPKNKLSNEMVRQEVPVEKNDARKKENSGNGSNGDAESNDSEESDSSSASEIKSNKSKGENSGNKSCKDKTEGKNSDKGLEKHRISIEDGNLNQKPVVEKRKTQETSKSETDSSSDSENESVRLERKNSKSKIREKMTDKEEDELIQKIKENLIKKSEALNQRDSETDSSESDSDEDVEKNKKSEKVELAHDSSKNAIPCEAENSKKAASEKRKARESSDSDSDSSKSEADKIKTLQKADSAKMPTDATENSRKNNSSSESETDSSSDSDSNAENKKRSEANKKTNLVNLEKKNEEIRRDGSDSSSSESESDDDSEKNKSSAKNILNDENARNETTASKSKTSSDSSSDSSSEDSSDEPVEMNDKQIQIDSSKIEEVMRNVSTNKDLLSKPKENKTAKISLLRSPAWSIYTSSEDEDSNSNKKKQESEKCNQTPVRILEIIQVKDSPGLSYFSNSNKRRLSQSSESIYSLEKGEVVSKTLGTEIKEDEGTPVKKPHSGNDSRSFNSGNDSEIQTVFEIPKAVGKKVERSTEKLKVKESEEKKLFNGVHLEKKAEKATTIEMVENLFTKGFNKKSLDVKRKPRTKKLPQEKKVTNSKRGAKTNTLPSRKKIKVDLGDDPVIDLEKLQLEILKKEMLTRAAAAAAAAAAKDKDKDKKDLDKKEEVVPEKKAPKKLTKKEEIKPIYVKEAELSEKEKASKKLYKEEAEESVKEDVKKGAEEDVKKGAEEDVKKSPAKKAEKDDEEKNEKPAEKKAVKSEGEKIVKPAEEVVVKPIVENNVTSSSEEEDEIVEGKIKKPAEKKSVKPAEENNVTSSSEEEDKKLIEEKVEEKIEKPTEKGAVKPAEKEVVKATKEEAVKPTKEKHVTLSSEKEDENLMEEKAEVKIKKSAKKDVLKPAEKEMKKLSEKKGKKLDKKAKKVSEDEEVQIPIKEDGAKKKSKKDKFRTVEVQSSENKKAKKSTSITNKLENEIEPLPSHIVSKLEPTKPPVIKKIEKPVKKLKRKAVEDIISDEEPPLSKKTATGDYIPLDVSGPTKFGVTPLNKFKKALPYSHHAAANFKNQMLYSERNRRLPSGKLNVFKEKQKFCK